MAEDFTDEEWEAELWERIRIQPPWLALRILERAFDLGNISREAFLRLAERPLPCAEGHHWSDWIPFNLHTVRGETRRCDVCHISEGRDRSEQAPRGDTDD